MNNNIRLTECRTQYPASRGPSIFLDKSGGYARSENFCNWNPIGNSMNFRRRSLMTGYLTFNWVSQGFRCNGLRFAPNCRCSQLANLTTIEVVVTCWSTTIPEQQQTTSASDTRYHCNISVWDLYLVTLLRRWQECGKFERRTGSPMTIP